MRNTSHRPFLYPKLKAMVFNGVAGVPGDTRGGARDAESAAAFFRRVLAATVAATVTTAADSAALLVQRVADILAASAVALTALPVDPAMIASCPKPPMPPRTRSPSAYPSGNMGSQGLPSSILSQRAARFGKGTSLLESHCCANQFDHQIWTQRMMNAGTWGLRWRSQRNIFLQLLMFPAHILSKRLQLFGGCVPLSKDGVAEGTQPVVLPTGL